MEVQPVPTLRPARALWHRDPAGPKIDDNFRLPLTDVLK
ncbi:hypothetical protein PATSB16_10290 [Pandoraea thiooxydans]|nr:hypothetical protein PATSB16_10290 [Pandoraea thiooxydans]